MAALLEMSKVHSPGSLAFITDEQALLVRVRGGWQYVQVGDSLIIYCFNFLFSFARNLFEKRKFERDKKEFRLH